MTVVLVDRLRPSLVPVEAITLLAGDVQYTEEMPVRVPWSLPAARPSHDGEEAPVLLSSDPEHPLVVARVAAGEQVIRSPGARSGERLVDAVALMDKLRTSGPWEREQTHDSLRRYLLEETYELFDAIRSGDAQLMREELGDVLLQVLFHARIAEDDADLPFGIDDVADALVRKLLNRAPGVLGGQQISLDQQLAQWEERKAAEKPRSSSMDDVPTGQPALALTRKVYDRAVAAGLPADLIPEEMAAVGTAPGGDPETALRSTALQFMDMIRKAEQSIAAGRRGEDVPEVLDVAHLGTVTEDEWRAHWPGAVRDDGASQGDSAAGEEVEDAEVAEAEVAEAEAAESDEAVEADVEVEEAEVGDAEGDEPEDEPVAGEPAAEVAASEPESDQEPADVEEPELSTENLEDLEPIAPEESAEAKARAD